MTRPQPVPWIAELAPAEHGSFDAWAARRAGLEDSSVLDFSVNGNGIGPPPGVAQALAGVDLSRYPDRGALALRQALAERHGVSPDQVVVGNGSTELIWAIARVYLAPGDSTLVVAPTYGEYKVASRAAGAQVGEAGIAPPGGDPDLGELSRRLEQERPRVLWLCHPNNPTGAPFPVKALGELAGRAPEALWVVDEAYLTLCEGLPSALSLVGDGRVAVLRSMTKDLGLAGVRLGYAVAAPGIADVLRRTLPPWNVGSLAQAAGLAALADGAHLQRARQAVADSRAHLVAGLEALGLRPYPSVANFVLVPVGNVAPLCRALLERGYAVRDCTSFGLPHCIRIGVRPIADQEQLLRALAEVCRG